MNKVADLVKKRAAAFAVGSKALVNSQKKGLTQIRARKLRARAMAREGAVRSITWAP